MERQSINGVPSYPFFHPPHSGLFLFFVILVLDCPHPEIAPPSKFATVFSVSDSICLSRTIPHSLLFFPRDGESWCVFPSVDVREISTQISISGLLIGWGKVFPEHLPHSFFQQPRFYPTKPNDPWNALAATLDSRAHRFHLQPSPPSGRIVFRSHRWGGRLRPQCLPPEGPDPAVGECGPASFFFE